MAQQMMSNMSPDQLADMQRQAANMPAEQKQAAMNMMQNMSPEQVRQMEQMAGGAGGTRPSASAPLPPSASVPGSQMSAQQKYQYDASMMLKTEGNKLFGAGKYQEAAEKYQRAIGNISSHCAQEAVVLLTSCRGNLASCCLQLERWEECVVQCDAVLQYDANNRKAVYRRGQARSALGRHEGAVRDLERALKLSPADENAVVKAKLDAAKAKQLAAAPGGVVIEEVDDDDEEVVVVAPPAAAAPSMFTTSGAAPVQQDMAAALTAMQQDPTVMKQAIDAMSSMSDADIALNMARQGANVPPGFSPEMAKMAANMLKGMDETQLK
jgi:tetratricopeptide (TPR) repeat protein